MTPEIILLPPAEQVEQPKYFCGHKWEKTLGDLYECQYCGLLGKEQTENERLA